MQPPKASVIIPSYNCQEFIGRAMRSVLNQTFQDFELIIVDDGSTDDTKEIIKEFIKKDKRIRYIYQENSGGPAKPMNTGILASRGEFVAFLDSDDEWLPEKLEKQLKLFKNSFNENLGLVSCNCDILYTEKNSQKILGEYKTPNFPSRNKAFKKLLRDCFIFSESSIVTKKKVLDKVGLFDENASVKGFQDWELWLRIIKNYDFSSLSKPLLKYYFHEANYSIEKIKNLRENIKFFEYILNKHKKDYQKYPKIYSFFLLRLAIGYSRLSDMQKGRKIFLQAIKINPLDIKNYFCFLISFFGVNFYRKIYKLYKFVKLKLIKDRVIRDILDKKIAV